MTTVLGIDHFFYVPDRAYDFLAEKSLPQYHEAHKALITSLTLDRNAPLRVLDLGAGSGVTSAYVLQNFVHSHVTAVDLFEEMLCEARARLAPFAERVDFAQADNSDFLRRTAARFDVIVTAFCIHHLLPAEKRELFRLVSNTLQSGGLFGMLDITTFQDAELKRAARERTIEHMCDNVTDEEYRQKWIHHWNEINVPDPADAMVSWLREAGLQTETVFRDFEIAVLRGRRP